MKKVIPALITILLLLSSGMAHSEEFRTAKPSDYGVYLYFQGVLEEFNGVLKELQGNESPCLSVGNFSNLTVLILGVIENYSTFGIPRSAITVATQFNYLGNDTLEFCMDEIRFKEDIMAGKYGAARRNLVEMGGILDDMNERVGALSRMDFKDENGTTVQFNLNGTVKMLDELHDRLLQWEETLNKLEGPEEFLIYLQTPRVIINESASFYGYRLNLTNVTVFIDGTPYEPEIRGNSFYLNHTFTEPGIHVVYATALNGSKTVESNILNVSVQRIPTVLTAHQERGEVKGVLMDYTGRGLPKKTIILILDGRRYSIVTSGNGSFGFRLPELLKTQNASLVFDGTQDYAPSNESIEVKPPKKRVLIMITSSSLNVREGPVEIRGRVIGTKETIPVEVYIDDNLSSVVNVPPNFTLMVTLREGTHTVYLRFPGNGEFAESISNTLKFNVRAVSYARRIALLLGLFLLGLVGYAAASKLKRGKEKGTPTSSTGTVNRDALSGEENQADPVSAYRIVYRTILRVYRLPRSTTPRELLLRFKNAPFGKWLEEATKFHERAFYRGTRLKAGEIARALKAAAMAIVSIFVGDEL
ncbi:hypothetical protein [Thermococcus sp.]